MIKLAYEIYLRQPVKITDITAGKEGEMETLSYIPGSTMRGAVLSAMKDVLDVPEKKRVLLSEQIQFLNAYPVCGGEQMFPSVKGFYESKLSNGELFCILGNEDLKPGYKRAGLGEFCCAEGSVLRYMRTRKKEVLSNNIGDNKVFRSVTLAQGQIFGSCILAKDSDAGRAAIDGIKKVLKTIPLTIGSGKTAGYGCIAIRNIREVKELPEFLPKITAPVSEAMMVLLSPMTMRGSNGEICGLDETALAAMLGDTVRVDVIKAASSTVKVSGVNRTWGCRTPEIVMYQSGSVFRLRFSEPVAPEKLAMIERQGLGVNRAEGCGRVCFTGIFDNITKKEELEPSLPEIEENTAACPEDCSALKRKLAKRAAMDKIISEMQKKIVDPKEGHLWTQMSRSQRGILLNQVKNARYNKEEAQKNIGQYIAHEEEKLKKERRHNITDNGKQQMISLLKKIAGKDIFESLALTDLRVMGYPVTELFSEEEKRNLYFKYAEEGIRYSARTDKEGMQ